MNILIPVAGLGRRMKSYGPKALIKINDETVLDRQIRLVREIVPTAKIVVVAGFEAEKVRRSLIHAKVGVVVNPYYEATNVAFSVALGLRFCDLSEPTLVIYGDLVFSSLTPVTIDNATSYAIIDSGNERQNEVGINVVDGRAACLSYGLPDKWAHLMVLRTREANLFAKIGSEPRRCRQFGFEVLNEVIDRGGVLDAFKVPGLSLVEIDSSKDIERAYRLVA